MPKTISVKNMFKKCQTHFGQFTNILPGCYKLDTVYISVSWMDNILQILNQMINKQHGESSFVLPFHSKINLRKKKKKIDKIVTSKLLMR